ncbi:MAG: carbon-nitrogen hydrolase family protein [Verrucomicrobia bacterium]|nr:carbon-nitrogen hydrolase family protein [Verrucomicrobiota bacterium]
MHALALPGRQLWLTLPALTFVLAGVTPVQALDGPVRVSVYQGPCRDGDFTANLDTARGVLQQARERASHFLVFPECFLSGYASAEAVRQGARGLEDAALQAFIRETADHDMVVIIGLVRRAGAALYNTALVVQGGRLLGYADKVVLTPDDRDALGFSAGQNVPVFAAHGVRFGVAICADTSYPHVALAAKLQGRNCSSRRTSTRSRRTLPTITGAG